MQNNKYSRVTHFPSGVKIYGIEIKTEKGVLYRYPHISAFADEADELIRQMSADCISPAHFDDIVTDYLVRLLHDRLSDNGLS